MEREITYDDVLMFIVKNKDNEEMMADLNRTTFPFTAKYKKNYWGQKIKETEPDNFLFEELRQRLSEELINRLGSDAKTARAISKKWINKEEYELFKEQHTFADKLMFQPEYLLWNFYDDCAGRVSDIERMLNYDDEIRLDGIAWLSRRLDGFDFEKYQTMANSESKEDILLHLAR